MRRVALQPWRMCCQKHSRPTPNGDTTPMPLMTTVGPAVACMGVTIIPTVSVSGSVPTNGARIFAWAGAALFAGSLLYFLYTYFVTFAETPPHAPHARVPVVWDALLFSVFALHHSVFARDGLRRRISQLVGPGLERSVYVWIASLLFIIVCATWVPIGGDLWRLDGIAVWIVWTAQVLGIWLTLRSAIVIDAFELAGVKQLSSSTEFKTVGPYGWVRHPIYLGWCVVVFAVPTMTMTRMVFAVT